MKNFAEEGAKILATGTKEEKLNNLKKNLTNIQTEIFNLRDHKKLKLL